MATTGDNLTTREQNVTVQKGSKVLTPPARTRPTTPADQEVDTVQVWPHLVVIEFLGAIIITINLVLLATLFNGPLEQLANPDKTPNPSKAPWYFLNLQELLLHMNPALAGVIVPTIALGLIAAIPYIDRGTRGLGVWWYSDRGPKIVIFTTIYSTVVSAVLIAVDEIVKLRTLFNNMFDPDGALGGITTFTGSILGGANVEAQNASAQGILVETVAGWLIPIFVLTFFPLLLVLLLKRIFRGIDLSEVIIGLFTGFVVVYWVLTIVGTAMRGPGMEFFPPWALPPPSEG
ncbi:MAG: menaquinol-cytochrome C reductase [Chloroflexota bacterium]|nr:menaquinol-cytochrome C reductase [Chloroflexota bacterium]MDQ5867224.1 menaquinol-cytochrome C reductase [Chloroflexota bacterium]